MARARPRTSRAGYRRIQVKVGAEPGEDVERVHAVRAAVDSGVVLFCDANGAWTTAQALAFLRATRALEITLEQPCMTYDECRALRPHCPHPLVLDECIDSLPALLAAHRDGVADGVTIKIARVGGIGPAALMRDVAVELGLPVTVEDTGGSDIDTAAIAHLSLSTPEELRIHTVDFNAWVTVGNATGMPPAESGQAARSGRDRPGRRGAARSARGAVRPGRLSQPVGHQARAAAAMTPAAAASPATTSARTRSGSSVLTMTPCRSTARRPTSGSTSRIAVTASTPCSSAASRRSLYASTSPREGDERGDQQPPVPAPVASLSP